MWPNVDTSKFTVYHVDLDKDTKSTQLFGVTKVPTIIVGKETDTGFKETKRRVGSMDAATTRKFLTEP